MLIDLRSDTVTLPSKAMLQAMVNAPLGDDVFGEDTSVIALEKKVATLFDKPSALFFPSGTMANQAAIHAQIKPRQEIICDRHSHIYLYEGGGLAFHSGLSTCLIEGNRGRLTAAQIEANIRPHNDYSPVTSIVAIENTHNRGGGSIYSLEEIKNIYTLCRKKGLKLHLDGARIFNAITASDYSAAEIGRYFNTLSVCLSKGLGAPVGSVVVMDGDLEHEMRKVRKVMGGGMRQAGVLAAAGLYALEHNISKLRDDHRRAKELESGLNDLPMVQNVLPVMTNIVVTQLRDDVDLNGFIRDLEEKGIKTVAFGPQAVRMVTHLDFTDEMLEYALEVFEKIGKKY
ncbi:MAG TPA: GntG family PLP-dependent aldolase [Bacteroidia bacterium]|nr:GntG family PLP-dependent aldolase [Bacteroidia bacterium]